MAKRNALPDCDHPRLSPRQREVVGLAAAGMRNLQIARQLGLEEGTVKLHLRNARLKVIAERLERD